MSSTPLPAPNFIDRAIVSLAPEYGIKRLNAKLAVAQLSYDAAHPGTARGGSGGLQKNAHSENPGSQRDRVALMWDSRDLVRQMPVLSCAVKRLGHYVCGRIRYQADVSDNPQVNSAYESYFENWCRSEADMTGRFDFRTLVELAFESAFTDGDIAASLALNPYTGRLSLQLIEADRVGDPRTVSAQIRDDYTSGVHLDATTGRVLGYDVFRRTKMNQYTFQSKVGPEQMRLLFVPDRPDQIRGVSQFRTVLAQARDLYEMFHFERGAAKWAASIAGVITQKDARNPGPTSVNAWDGKTAEGTPTSTIVPNKIIRLGDGDSVTPFNTNGRPAGAFMSYIEIAIRDIAMGLNLPYGFFDMSKFGGATSRLETMQVQRVIERWQQVLESQFLNWVKNAVIDEGVALGELPATPRRHAGRWNFGAHITADVGYQTAANLQLLAAGLTTHSKLAAEQGEDFEEIVEKLASEAQLVHGTASRKGIPAELIITAAAGFTEAMANMEAAKLPAPQPSIVDQKGADVAKLIAECIAGIHRGDYSPETAQGMLVEIYGLNPAVAARLVAFAPPPAPATPPVGLAPAADKTPKA